MFVEDQAEGQVEDSIEAQNEDQIQGQSGKKKKKKKKRKDVASESSGSTVIDNLSNLDMRERKETFQKYYLVESMFINDSFFKAIYEGDEKMVESLIALNPNNVNKTMVTVTLGTKEKITPLIAAIRNFQFQIARKLIAAGADVKAMAMQLNHHPEPICNHVVCIAAFRDDQLTKEILALPQIDRYADESMLSNTFYKVIFSGLMNAITVFLDSKKLTIFSLVGAYNLEAIKNFPAIKLLLKNEILERCKSIDLDNPYEILDIFHAFACCCRNAMREIADAIFDGLKERKNSKGEKLIERIFTFSYLPIHQGLPLAKYLVSKGVDIRLPTLVFTTVVELPNGRRRPVQTKSSDALFGAVENQNTAFVKYLLGVGANPNIYYRFFRKCYTQEMIDSAKSIPNEIRPHIEIVDKKNLANREQECLIEHDSYREKLKKVNDINVEQGMMYDVNIAKTRTLSDVKDTQEYFNNATAVPFCPGRTPLIMAVISKNNPIMDLLLEKDADVDAVDINNMSALMYAAMTNNLYAVKKLLERGANKDLESDSDKTAFMLATNKDIRKLLAPDLSKTVVDTKPVNQEPRVDANSESKNPIKSEPVSSELPRALNENSPLAKEIQKNKNSKLLKEVERCYLFLRELLDKKIDEALPKVPQLILIRNAMLGALARMLRAIRCYIKLYASGNGIFPIEWAGKLSNVIFHPHNTKLAKMATNFDDNQNLNNGVKAMVKMVLDVMDSSEDATSKVAQFKQSLAKSESNGTRKLWQQLCEKEYSDLANADRHKQMSLAKQDLRAYKKLLENNSSEIAEFADGYTAARLNTYVDDATLALLKDFSQNQTLFAAISHARDKGYLFRHPEREEDTPRIVSVAPGTAKKITLGIGREELGTQVSLTERVENASQDSAPKITPP